MGKFEDSKGKKDLAKKGQDAMPNAEGQIPSAEQYLIDQYLLADATPNTTGAIPSAEQYLVDDVLGDAPHVREANERMHHKELHDRVLSVSRRLGARTQNYYAEVDHLPTMKNYDSGNYGLKQLNGK